MAALGPLGIGLSIVFGGFVLVLLGELYYVFFWKKYGILSRRVSRIGAEYCSERGDFAHEAALVGSFGGYSESSAEAEFVAKLFPMGPEGGDDYDSLYMHSVFRNPNFLFTIKEETKEDMDFEEPGKHKDVESNKNASFHSATQPLQSSPSKMSLESTSPKQQQQKQWQHQQQQKQWQHQQPKQQWQHQQHLNQFPYSIGLIQQPQLLRSMSTKCVSHHGLIAPMHHNMLRASADSPQTSPSLPSSPAHRSSSSSPSRPISVSVSPSFCSRSSSPKQQACSSSGSSSPNHSRSGLSSPNEHASIRVGSHSPQLVSVSNPIYEVDSNEFYCNVNSNKFSAPPQHDGLSGSNQSSGPSSDSLETETPFGTPISSPSLLTPSETPPGTPPLTPMKAPNDPSAFLKSMGQYRSGKASALSSSKTSPSFSPSNCSSPSPDSSKKKPSYCHLQRPPRSPPTVAVPHHLVRQPTLMERRAFVSLFNQPDLQTLPRESPCWKVLTPNPMFCNGTTRPGSNNSSNATSPSTPFSTAPSTPYFTSPNQCPLTDSQKFTHSSMCS
ncbi:hypothetical protein SUGI_0099380 [Cryptomeria japonica]|uniref:uncharacterized protein LOC131052316 n=1 Tax=Cryptomeria japonica TaxID=3369 RepID=UPI002408A8E6|nr:uncharacterized protein LOC131052316 [Cryptomeria japonica]XP_057842928.1 uncharacterized protein LOC131052316 [Cryptomeria japonica]GLJ08964.1 hypothetical protein SUGI_0099380 [Cryptomeria japonica]